MGFKEVDPGKAEHFNALRKKYLDLIEYGNTHPQEAQQNLHKLRQLILLEGLPPESEVLPHSQWAAI